MDKFLTFGVVGLSVAATYAIMASGLVVTYATTGIFNFAHGAVGMLGAFQYWHLTQRWGLPAPVALVVVVAVVAPATGMLIDHLVMRHLRHASEAVRLVVSVSVLTALIGLARWIWNPGEARTVRRFFAQWEPISVGPTTITWHQATTIVVAAAVAVGLRLFLFRTRAGLVMRASVDDADLTTLNGARPQVAARTAWGIGSALAALGGILMAPNVAMDANVLSLTIVSAYAAAVVGRLRSLPLTFLGALLVGGTESYLAGYLPSNAHLTGLRLASPALLLLVVLLVLPQQRIRSRVRTTEPIPLPRWAPSLRLAGAIIVGSLVLATTLGRADAVSFGRLFSYGLIALSFVPLVGYSGQISLCQLSLAGIGSLAYVHLAPGSALGLVLAMVVTGAVGALIALPALRLSGIYLALGTSAFAIALDRWIFKLPPWKLPGGFELQLFGQGSVVVEPLTLLGWRVDEPAHQMVFSAVVLAAMCLWVVAVRRGFFGRRLIAVQDSEVACSTLGVNLVVTKVVVFAWSASLAGLGGALWSIQAGTISAEFFDFFGGLQVFVLTVIGGVSALGGALFAGIALTAALPLVIRLLPWAESPLAVAPGAAGAALGSSPGGVLPLVRAPWAPLFDDRLLVAAAAGLGASWWLVRVAGLIDNAAFVTGLVVGVAALRGLAALRRRGRGVGPLDRGAPAGPQARAAARPANDVGPGEPMGPVERWGVDVPWRAEDRAALDAGLAETAGGW